jgi:hypothetical protein
MNTNRTNMKKMKNLLIFGMMLATLSVACKKKGCMDVEAVNYDSNAEKQNSTCKYKMAIHRDMFLGSCNVIDSSYIADNFSERKAYTVEIITGGTISDTIFLNNLFDSGESYMAILKSSLTFTIPSQQVGGTHYVTGSGEYSSGKITIQTHRDDVNGDISNRIEGLK